MGSYPDVCHCFCRFQETHIKASCNVSDFEANAAASIHFDVRVECEVQKRSRELYTESAHVISRAMSLRRDFLLAEYVLAGQSSWSFSTAELVDSSHTVLSRDSD